MSDSRPAGVGDAIDVRLGTPLDVAEVVAIDPRSADPDRQDLVAEALDRGSCWIAVADGRVVGYLVVNTDFYQQPFIWLVVVAASARRKGVATVLVRQAIDRFEGRRVFTSANESNTASRALFASLGFEPAGRIDQLDPGDPELVLVRHPVSFQGARVRMEAGQGSQPGPDTVARVALGAACVIVDPDGQVLLVRHTYGRHNWELPGGHGEPGEDLLVTALRELREETGIEAAGGVLTGLYLEPRHEVGAMLHAVVRVAWTPTMRPTPSSPEIAEVRWCDPSALPGPISDFTVRRIADALAPGPPVSATIGPRRWSDTGAATTALDAPKSDP